MIIRLTKRLLFGRSKKKRTKKIEDQRNTENAKLKVKETVIAPRRTPEWEHALIISLKDNCLAPAEEVILHSYDLYCDERNEPVHIRQQKMAMLYSEILADVADLQSFVPDLIERAMARHPHEFAFHIEKKGAA